MKREFKFRGKRNANDKWIYGCLYRSWAIETETPAGLKVYGAVPDTIGQFTGIKDVNGAEIYEGDIIEVTLQHNKESVSTYKAVVDMKEGAFGFKNKQGFAPFYGQTHENFKVVGNIFDNPELLKGGAK